MKGINIAALLFIGTVVAACGTSAVTQGTTGDSSPVTVAANAPSTTATVQTTVSVTIPSPPTTLVAQVVESTEPITGMVWKQVSPYSIEASVSGPTLLVSGGDRFIIVDGSNVRSSFDGRNWTTVPIEGSIDDLRSIVAWQDTVVGFGCGGWISSGDSLQSMPVASCLSILHPDGAVARRTFDGQIIAVGVGPSGIVVVVTDSRDENGLLYANKDEMAEALTGRDINDFSEVELTDGVLHVEYGGESADFVIADRGYVDSESQVASGWFSQDGEEWTPITDFPLADRWSLIGTEDGFIGISEGLDSDPVVWHSSDGIHWRDLGRSPDFRWTLSRWNDGALVVGTESVSYISGRGVEQLSLLSTEHEPVVSASGNIGAVKIDIEPVTFQLNRILYSPGGERWINTSLPPEMSDLELTIDPDHLPVEAVATDTNVMLLLNEGNTEGDYSTLVWFLGTPTTG